MVIEKAETAEEKRKRAIDEEKEHLTKLHDNKLSTSAVLSKLLLALQHDSDKLELE